MGKKIEYMDLSVLFPKNLTCCPLTRQHTSSSITPSASFIIYGLGCMLTFDVILTVNV